MKKSISLNSKMTIFDHMQFTSAIIFFPSVSTFQTNLLDTGCKFHKVQGSQLSYILPYPQSQANSTLASKIILDIFFSDWVTLQKLWERRGKESLFYYPNATIIFVSSN